MFKKTKIQKTMQTTFKQQIEAVQQAIQLLQDSAKGTSRENKNWIESLCLALNDAGSSIAGMRIVEELDKETEEVLFV
jgi:hypothetical protein